MTKSRKLEAAPESAVAFGEGSDARLGGLPKTENPYRDDQGLRVMWQRGWLDVDRNYGSAARWPVKALPAVVVAA